MKLKNIDVVKVEHKAAGRKAALTRYRALEKVQRHAACYSLTGAEAKALEDIITLVKAEAGLK